MIVCIDFALVANELRSSFTSSVVDYTPPGFDLLLFVCSFVHHRYDTMCSSFDMSDSTAAKEMQALDDEIDAIARPITPRKSIASVVVCVLAFDDVPDFVSFVIFCFR